MTADTWEKCCRFPNRAFVGKKVAWGAVRARRPDPQRVPGCWMMAEIRVPGGESSPKVALCRLVELGQVGPDRRDVWDGFERTDTVTAYPMVENHDTEQRRRLVAGPRHILGSSRQTPPWPKLKAVEHLWPKAGRLLISERLMAGNHEGCRDAVRYASPVKRMVACSGRRFGNRKGDRGLVELQLLGC